MSNNNLYEAANLLKQHCGSRPQCTGCIFFPNGHCALQQHVPVYWNLSMFANTQEDTQEEND